MPLIRDIAEAEATLLPYVPLVAQAKANTTLDRVWPLMKLAGNPQDRLKIIHVAGTSGKTSTAYYLAALLKAGGQKVGMTISPHVDSITERLQINGQPLDEATFCQELSQFLKIVERAGEPPSYFELLYTFALWVFDRQGVDYAVIETGMGGLRDATNVATRPDKVCVITDIGLDHTNVLGQTLQEIAHQKIGIVHHKNTVFSYRQSDEIMKVFRDWCQQQQAELNVVSDETGQFVATMPAYQQRNWQLAYSTYRYLENRDKSQHLTSQVLLETQRIRIPARMDIRNIQTKTLIMDGAHNAQKMTAFLTSFQRLYPGIKPAVLIGLKEGKEHEALVPLLKPVVARIITTTFNTSQDLPSKSMDSQKLAEAFTAADMPAESIPDQTTAYKTLLAAPEKILIITGSFYLLSQIRNNEHLI